MELAERFRKQRHQYMRNKLKIVLAVKLTHLTCGAQISKGYSTIFTFPFNAFATSSNVEITLSEPYAGAKSHN